MGGGGRMDTCVCMAESLCCPPEIITTLLISYTPTQNKKFKKKKKRFSFSGPSLEQAGQATGPRLGRTVSSSVSCKPTCVFSSGCPPPHQPPSPSFLDPWKKIFTERLILHEQQEREFSWCWVNRHPPPLLPLFLHHPQLLTPPRRNSSLREFSA